MITLFTRISFFFVLWAQSVYSAASSTASQDELDLKAVHMSAAVFHGYAEHLEEEAETLSLGSPIVRQRYCGLMTQVYDELPQFSSWALVPFKGHLGFYVAWAAQGCPQNEYFGMVGYDPNANLICVSFRGTQPTSEYLYNNIKTAVKLPLSARTGRSLRDLKCISGWHHLAFDGPLHAGYYNRLLTCATSLFSALTEILAKVPEDAQKPSLLITGHSLGGSSACIFAGLIVSPKIETDNPGMADLLGLKDSFSDINLRVFGSPRVSCRSYGEWLQAQDVTIKNFVCETDSIPSFPPIQFREPGLPYSLAYEHIVDPVILKSYGVPKRMIIYAHDIRLYVKAMEARHGVQYADAFPLFRLSPDTDFIKKILFPCPILEL